MLGQNGDRLKDLRKIFDAKLTAFHQNGQLISIRRKHKDPEDLENITQVILNELEVLLMERGNLRKMIFDHVKDLQNLHVFEKVQLDRPPENIYNTLTRLFQEICNLNIELQGLKADYEQSRSQLNKINQHVEGEIQRRHGKLIRRIQQQDTEKLDLTRRLSASEQIVESNRVKYESDLENHRTWHQVAKEGEISLLKKDHEHQIDQLIKAHERRNHILQKEVEQAQSAAGAAVTNAQNQIDIALAAEKEKLMGIFDQKKEEVITKHTMEVSKLENSLKDERMKVMNQENILKATLASKESEVRAMQESFNNEKRILERDHGIKLKELEAICIAVEEKKDAELETAQKSHEEEKRKLKQDHESQITEQSSLHKRELGNRAKELVDMQTAHKNIVNMMGQKHLAEKKEMGLTFQAKMEEQATHHQEGMRKMEAEIKALEAEIGMIQGEYEHEMKQMNEGFVAQEARMNREFEAKIEQMEKERIYQQASLRKDIAYLNKELGSRDSFKALTDQELKSPYITLNKEIDSFSRVIQKWNSNQTEWPMELLNRLSDNGRKLRQQLSHDMMWIILFERIFCSPFRVFGEGGKVLERQWNESFGTESEAQIGSYSWPKPSHGSERWRYRTITGLEEAVTQPASKWDASSELKTEYNNSLNEITKELLETFEKVSQLDKEAQQALKQIPRKAAELWMKMTKQRCRITVFLPGSNTKSQAERVSKAKERKLELVAMPELRRYGDWEGQDLEKMEIISAGSTIKLPTK